MSDDMQTMPIRDLITGLRIKTKEMDPSQMITILIINCLTNRLEQQANELDRAEYTRIQQVALVQKYMDNRRNIRNAALPDPNDERDISLPWLVNIIMSETA